MTDYAPQMRAIHERWGAPIAQACSTSSVPPALLAAIVANESNGDPSAKRFEPSVLLKLWDVLVGRSAAFGSIGAEDITRAINPFCAWTKNVANLDALATSWGLTQIMGYNFLGGVGKLTDPSTNLYRAISLLTGFAKEFNLSLAKEPGELLACWNTGHPSTSPTPSEYVQNGLARMAAYQAILDAPAADATGEVSA